MVIGRILYLRPNNVNIGLTFDETVEDVEDVEDVSSLIDVARCN